MTTFTRQADAVLMVTDRGSFRLNADLCDRLLDIWEEADAAPLFNELYEAAGDLIIPRVTSFRARKYPAREASAELGRIFDRRI